MAYRNRRRLTRVVCVCLGISALQPPVFAKPSVPDDPATVLEVLPELLSGEQRGLRDLHLQLATTPKDLKLAGNLAWRYIDLARREADPRFLGRAEAVLSPWAYEGSPPVAIRVLRATLLQQRHAFAPALQELELALKEDPRNAQAWLTRATVLQVQANYPEARRSCAPLLRFASVLTATSCLASIDALSGETPKAFALLQQVTAQSLDEEPQTRSWALTLLGEIAARLGRDVEAEQAFHDALAMGRDAYLLGAYADFLLDRQRASEVLPLLQDRTRTDGLLLRQILAQRALGNAATSGEKELQARFAANRKRGESLHLGEEARFTLHVLAQPSTALLLAQQNWAVQREPRDGRVLLEATLATGKKSAGEPVLALLRREWRYDQTLVRLAAPLN